MRTLPRAFIFVTALLATGCGPKPSGDTTTPPASPVAAQDFRANARDYLPRLDISVEESGLVTEDTTTDPQRYLILSLAVHVTNIGNRDINYLEFSATYEIPGVYRDVQVVKPFERESATLKKDGGTRSFVVQFRRSPISEQAMELASRSRLTHSVKLQEVGFVD